MLSTGLLQEQSKGLGWAGEGGSSSSLRGSGKNWSEQAGDCSCCLIRTDVTQHNPPQQSVLRLEQVIFERKVQSAWKAAALCPLTAYDRESWCATHTSFLSHTPYNSGTVSHTYCTNSPDSHDTNLIIMGICQELTKKAKNINLGGYFLYLVLLRL